jgi:hypothetical protein
MRTRKEVIDAQRHKYQKSMKKGKQRILDSVCEATGLSRDRASRLLRGPGTPKQRQNRKDARGRKVKYDKETAKALERIWALMDFACGKRLAAGMVVMLDALERHNEFGIDPGTAQKLKEMSPATADRLLKPAKRELAFKGISTTKPGTLLKKDIPLRLGTEWDDAVPGYVEVDLVAHCGSTTAGDYVNTLDVTDVCTGWTETRAVINKARRHVFEALLYIETNLPFPYKGIDSDNGSEFINHHLYTYCKDNGICFTRSRPYAKNDNCRVEQKNWAVVRRNIGYDRYEGGQAVGLLNLYYEKLRLHSNFFLPQTKLISKCREGAKVRKKYEPPKTPYQRVLESAHVPGAAKEELTDVFLSLNPASLKRDMLEILGAAKKIRMPWHSCNN